METAELPRKAGGKIKYNWPLVFGEVDSGLPWRNVAEKYSIPERVMYEKLRHRKKELANGVRNHGLRPEGKPAALPCKIDKRNQIAIISDPPAAAQLTESELAGILADPQAVLALSPEDAQQLFARQLQMRAAEALAIPMEPRTVKDQLALVKAFREAAGLTGDKGKGSNGLLSPPRSFGRRAVGTTTVLVDAEVEESPADGWPEGM